MKTEALIDTGSWWKTGSVCKVKFCLPNLALEVKLYTWGIPHHDLRESSCENKPIMSLKLEIYTALIWQKEASDKSDISCKRAKCVCHLHWRQWNIRMSYLTYLLVGWVFLHEIWPGRRAHYVNYENINNSNLDGMSLASFCQSRAVYCPNLAKGSKWQKWNFS